MSLLYFKRAFCMVLWIYTMGMGTSWRSFLIILIVCDWNQISVSVPETKAKVGYVPVTAQIWFDSIFAAFIFAPNDFTSYPVPFQPMVVDIIHFLFEIWFKLPCFDKNRRPIYKIFKFQISFSCGLKLKAFIFPYLNQKSSFGCTLINKIYRDNAHKNAGTKFISETAPSIIISSHSGMVLCM